MDRKCARSARPSQTLLFPPWQILCEGPTSTGHLRPAIFGKHFSSQGLKKVDFSKIRLRYCKVGCKILVDVVIIFVRKIQFMNVYFRPWLNKRLCGIWQTLLYGKNASWYYYYMSPYFTTSDGNILDIKCAYCLY